MYLQLLRSLFSKQNRIYFKEEKPDTKGYKVNLDQSWNPVDNYIYGRAIQSIYNQHTKKEESLKKFERILNSNTVSSRDRDKNKINDDFSSKAKSKSDRNNNPMHRKLLGEFINNESPRL